MTRGADPMQAELKALVKAALTALYKESCAKLPTGTKNRVLVAFNARRTARHLPIVADDAAMVDAFLAYRPDANQFRERAARNVAKRAEMAPL